jgi:hypothetical protein
MPDYTSGRLIALVRSLASATEGGALKWEETDRKSAFLLTRPQGTALIESVDDDGAHPYRLLLLDPEGTVIETLEEDRHSVEPWDRELENLYRLARVSAKNIDRAIDAWIDDLKKLSDEPPF